MSSWDSASKQKNNELSSFMLRPGKGKRLLNAVKRTVIFVQGDQAEAIFYLVKGSVKATISSSAGKAATVNIFTDRQFFGCGCLTNSESVRRYTAVTLTASKIVRIEPAAMVHLLLSRENVLYAFIESITSCNDILIDNLGSNLLLPAGQRLARVLLQLARVQDPDRSPYLPKLSQQDLGDMIGASRQHVNSELQRLRKLGDIQYSSGLQNLQVFASLSKRAQ